MEQLGIMMENPRGEFGNSKGKDLGEIKGRICNIVERIQEEFAKIKEWTQENQSKVGSLKGILRKISMWAKLLGEFG